MLFDKIYKESYSREELIEVYRQTVPRLNKRKGNTGNRYCYITNGVEIKKADPDLPIPEGPVNRMAFPSSATAEA